MHYLNKGHSTSFVVQKFLSNYQWLFTISSLYEIILLIHTAAVCSILGLQSYGLLASYLSFVYLMGHLLDAGATNSLPIFFNLFLKNKKNFNYLLWRYTALPHGTLMVIATGITTVFFTYLLPQHFLHYSWILVMLVIMSAINAFLRQFLYSALKTKEAALTEFLLLIMRLTALWSLYLLFHVPLTISTYLYCCLGEALCCFLTFAYFMRQLYKPLPLHDLELPEKILISLMHNRWWSYVLRLSRAIFSSNFLTPLFAVHYGFVSAAIFSLAKKSSKIIQSAIKLCIGYSGNSLFATFTHNSLAEKQSIFNLLRNKLIHIMLLAPLTCLIGVSIFQLFPSGGDQQNAHTYVISATLLIAITCSEGLVTLYEQFYIAEERAPVLAILKVGELLVLYSLFKVGIWSTTELLAAVLVVHLMSFAIIASYAYCHWRIAPLKSLPLNNNKCFEKTC